MIRRDFAARPGVGVVHRMGAVATRGVASLTAIAFFATGCFSVLDPSLTRTGRLHDPEHRGSGLHEGVLLAERTDAWQPVTTPGSVPPATAPGTPTVSGTTPAPGEPAGPAAADPSTTAPAPAGIPSAASGTAQDATTGQPLAGDAAEVSESAFDSRAVDDVESDRDEPRRLTPERRQRIRTGLFWTGIGVLAIGGAATIAFGATGRAVQAQLDDGYDDGSLTRAREQDLTDRGTLMNGLALTTGVLAIAGLGLAAISFGLDYTACGKLAQRKRPDCQPRRTHE